MHQEMVPLLSPVPNAMLGLDPGLVWAVALVAALGYGLYGSRRSGLDPRSMYWTGICTMLGGLWGAHVLDLAANGSNGDPLAWVRFWVGAKSYYGGLFGGVLAGVVFLRLRRLPVLAYADAVVPAVALGYGIGRVGCFLNGDDYGTLSSLPWAVRYSPGTEAQVAHLTQGLIDSMEVLSLPIHPVQLYASLLGFSMFALLARWPVTRPGDRFYLFAVLYGAARFAMEWLRGDFKAALGPLSLPQVCSVLLVFVGVGCWLGFHKGIEIRIRSQAVSVSGIRGYRV
jgi:phosphatidylglycerol:prolipoprotein diacylglycerol transferase